MLESFLSPLQKCLSYLGHGWGLSACKQAKHIWASGNTTRTLHAALLQGTNLVTSWLPLHSDGLHRSASTHHWIMAVLIKADGWKASWEQQQSNASFHKTTHTIIKHFYCDHSVKVYCSAEIKTALNSCRSHLPHHSPPGSQTVKIKGQSLLF